MIAPTVINHPTSPLMATLHFASSISTSNIGRPLSNHRMFTSLDPYYLTPHFFCTHHKSLEDLLRWSHI